MQVVDCDPSDALGQPSTAVEAEDLQHGQETNQWPPKKRARGFRCNLETSEPRLLDWEQARHGQQPSNPVRHAFVQHLTHRNQSRYPKSSHAVASHGTRAARASDIQLNAFLHKATIKG